MKDVKAEVRRIERRMQKVEALNGLIGEAYVQKLRDAERLRNLAKAVVESIGPRKTLVRRGTRLAVDAEPLLSLSALLSRLPRFAKGRATRRKK